MAETNRIPPSHFAGIVLRSHPGLRWQRVFHDRYRPKGRMEWVWRGWTLWDVQQWITDAILTVSRREGLDVNTPRYRYLESYAYMVTVATALKKLCLTPGMIRVNWSVSWNPDRREGQPAQGYPVVDL